MSWAGRALFAEAAVAMGLRARHFILLALDWGEVIQILIVLSIFMTVAWAATVAFEET